MDFQLTEDELVIVKDILNCHLKNVGCHLFGSRVKGTAKRYSDLDIVLIDSKPLSLQLLSTLEEAFSNSNLPFKVDLVDWHRITPEFQNKIKNEMRAIVDE